MGAAPALSSLEWPYGQGRECFERIICFLDSGEGNTGSIYLRYDRYLADGLPIATGVIEGACLHLVKDRMEITGAKWGLQGAESVLRLRALRASKDFDAYWVFHVLPSASSRTPSG